MEIKIKILPRENVLKHVVISTEMYSETTQTLSLQNMERWCLNSNYQILNFVQCFGFSITLFSNSDINIVEESQNILITNKQSSSFLKMLDSSLKNNNNNNTFWVNLALF